MWRKIYNAIWADKARRAAVLTIIIALIVSGTALAILNTIGKSKPAQGIPDEQPLIGTEVADLLWFALRRAIAQRLGYLS